MDAPVTRVDTACATTHTWTAGWQAHWRFITKESDVDVPGILLDSSGCNFEFHRRDVWRKLQQRFFGGGKLAVIR